MYKLVFALLVLFSVLLNAQYQNVRVSSSGSTDPEEVAIAINPMHPNHLGAGANITYFYSSTNSGVSWTQRTMNSTLGVWGDPVVIYDGLNNLYFGHLSNPINGYWIDRIVVQKSTDNGTTWNNGSGIGYNYPKNQDKHWLAVDLQNNRYKNFLYVTWTEFDDYGSGSSADSSRILFSRSTDHGDTWSQPVRLSDRGGDCIDSDNTTEGAVPAIGPNGEIYTAWSGPLGIMMDRSTNGGLTWGTDIFVSSQPGGWDFDVPGIYRCNGMPITLCDTSHSATRGFLYVVWGDLRNGTDNSDVFIKRSTNGGTTWGDVIRVNNDITTRHQFFPWAAIDQTTGHIYVVFYDRRHTSGAATDVYVARSVDGGKRFENFKVSQNPFTPNSGVFFGDYTNIAALGKKIYPIWMRMDNNSLSVWTACINDSLKNTLSHADFKSVVDQGTVSLSWECLEGSDCSRFEIQRTIPGNGRNTEWLTIGAVELNPTGYYTFTDRPGRPGTYLYRIKQYNSEGNSGYSEEIQVDILTDKQFTLYQNYPNPFNPSTTIGYYLPEAAVVKLTVYNTSGEEVAVLVNEFKDPGEHEAQFDASGFGSGVYLCKISAGEHTDFKKMILLK